MPHYSTLKLFADRNDTLVIVDEMLTGIVSQVAKQSSEEEVAIDATGVDRTPASEYYCTCGRRKRKWYAKLSPRVTCGTMLLAIFVIELVPCNDKAVATELLHKSSDAIQPKTLFADAGYDAEWVREYCRDGWGLRQLDSSGRASQRWRCE